MIDYKGIFDNINSRNLLETKTKTEMKGFRIPRKTKKKFNNWRKKIISTTVSSKYKDSTKKEITGGLFSIYKSWTKGKMTEIFIEETQS